MINSSTFLGENLFYREILKKVLINSMIIAQPYYLCNLSKSVYEADRKQHTEDCCLVQEVQG